MNEINPKLVDTICDDILRAKQKQKNKQFDVKDHHKNSKRKLAIYSRISTNN